MDPPPVARRARAYRIQLLDVLQRLARTDAGFADLFDHAAPASTKREVVDAITDLAVKLDEINKWDDATWAGKRGKNVASVVLCVLLFFAANVAVAWTYTHGSVQPTPTNVATTTAWYLAISGVLATTIASSVMALSRIDAQRAADRRVLNAVTHDVVGSGALFRYLLFVGYRNAGESEAADGVAADLAKTDPTFVRIFGKNVSNQNSDVDYDLVYKEFSSYLRAGALDLSKPGSVDADPELAATEVSLTLARSWERMVLSRYQAQEDVEARVTEILWNASRSRGTSETPAESAVVRTVLALQTYAVGLGQVVPDATTASTLALLASRDIRGVVPVFESPVARKALADAYDAVAATDTAALCWCNDPGELMNKVLGRAAPGVIDQDFVNLMTRGRYLARASEAYYVRNRTALARHARVAVAKPFDDDAVLRPGRILSALRSRGGVCDALLDVYSVFLDAWARDVSSGAAPPAEKFVNRERFSAAVDAEILAGRWPGVVADLDVRRVKDLVDSLYRDVSSAVSSRDKTRNDPFYPRDRDSTLALVAGTFATATLVAVLARVELGFWLAESYSAWPKAALLASASFFAVVTGWCLHRDAVSKLRTDKDTVEANTAAMKAGVADVDQALSHPFDKDRLYVAMVTTVQNFEKYTYLTSLRRVRAFPYSDVIVSVVCIVTAAVAAAYLWTTLRPLDHFGRIRELTRLKDAAGLDMSAFLRLTAEHATTMHGSGVVLRFLTVVGACAFLVVYGIVMAVTGAR